MTDKIIAMPTDDEIFEAFKHALEVGTPENKKNILGMFEKFLEKAKDHLKDIMAMTATGLSLNLTEETGNNLLAGFINAQGFLLKLPLKAILSTFGADSFTNFIASTKSGKNNKEVTISGFTTIVSVCFSTLGEKYAVVETDETVKTKVAAVFADSAPTA